MTPALPGVGIRHSEFDPNQSHQQEPRRVCLPAAVWHEFFTEPRARLSPGAQREYSGNRRLVPVEVPDVVE
jgi:hypothetical protein